MKSGGNLTASGLLHFGALFAVSCAICYFAFQSLHHHAFLIAHQYPAEFREGAVLYFTELLLQNANPYSLELMPLGTNVYGIVYHLLVYPFAYIWGPTLFVHRSVSMVFLVLSCGTVFLVLRRQSVSFIYCLAAGLLLYILLLFYITPLARPDTLGLFLLLLSLYIPALAGYSAKSLLASITLGLIAFYTKTYFSLGIPYMSLYLFFFVSKKRAILYALAAAALGIASAAVIKGIFETYFMCTLFIHQKVAGNNISFAIEQLRLFVFIHAGLLAAAPIYLMCRFGQVRTFWAHTRLCLSTLNTPLFSGCPVTLSAHCFACSLIVVFFWMGRHEGNYMTYLFQLMSPFLIIWICGLTAGSTAPACKTFCELAFAFLIIISLYRAHDFLYFKSNSNFFDRTSKWHHEIDFDEQPWIRIKESVDRFPRILNSPLIVPLLLKRDMPVYDTGQSEYFRYMLRAENLLERLLAPAGGTPEPRWSCYVQSIHAAIERREFKALIIGQYDGIMYSMDQVSKYYNLASSAEITLFHTGQNIRLNTWLPKH